MAVTFNFWCFLWRSHAPRETTSDNSKTAYRVGVIAKLPYVADTHAGQERSPDYRSFTWAKIRGFTSNPMHTSPSIIRFGSFVTGIAIATYNGADRAVLDSWSLTDFAEWRFASRPTLIGSDELSILFP